MEHFKTFENQ
jgi:hypothetical protein